MPVIANVGVRLRHAALCHALRHSSVREKLVHTTATLEQLRTTSRVTRYRALVAAPESSPRAQQNSRGESITLLPQRGRSAAPRDRILLLKFRWGAR